MFILITEMTGRARGRGVARGRGALQAQDAAPPRRPATAAPASHPAAEVR